MYGIPLDIAETIRDSFGKSTFRGQHKDIVQSWTYKGDTITYTLSSVGEGKDEPYVKLTIDVKTRNDTYRFAEIRRITGIDINEFYRYECGKKCKGNCGDPRTPMVVGMLAVVYEGGILNINVLT